MHSPISLADNPARLTPDPFLKTLLLSTLGAWQIGFGFVCLMLVAGRFRGSMETPLDITAMLLLCSVLAVQSATTLWLSRVTTKDVLLNVIAIANSLFVCMIAVVVSLPETSPLPLIFLWTFVLVWESVRWKRSAMSLLERVSATESNADTHDVGPQHETTIHTPEIDSEGLSEDLQQQVSRFRNDGLDTIVCQTRASFEPNQRIANIHITICPPFQNTPQIEAHQVEGSDVSIKVRSRETYGVHLELRLQRASAETSNVVVESIISDTN